MMYGVSPSVRTIFCADDVEKHFIEVEGKGVLTEHLAMISKVSAGDLNIFDMVLSICVGGYLAFAVTKYSHGAQYHYFSRLKYFFSPI